MSASTLFTGSAALFAVSLGAAIARVNETTPDPGLGAGLALGFSGMVWTAAWMWFT